MIQSTLSETTSKSEVNNILIFVSDSLRYDHLPTAVEEKGVVAKAIAPSTFTASSLPSITTGQYPSSHGVWMFNDTLPETPRILDLDSHDIGFDADGIWIDLPSAEKPPLRINRLSEERELDDLSPPFLHVVHDMGPHAPYGFENGTFESTKEFFKNHENQCESLRELYDQNSVSSAERFLKLYRTIKDKGLLDDTLLIFTSDHGEALGEERNGGRFGHGHPLSPETVEVPIVFCGAGLPEGAEYQPLLSGTDIVPTILAALGKGAASAFDGTDVWTGTPESDRLLRSEVWQHMNIDAFGVDKDISVYCATSTWDNRGGHVFHRKSTLERMGALAYDNLFRGYSPAWRANINLRKTIKMGQLTTGSYFEYGTPAHTVERARDLTPDEIVDDVEHDADSLNQAQKEHLQDMGYL